MPDDIDNGGPAFPGTNSRTFKRECTKSPADPDFETYGDAGMSLRDWLAGMALQGLLANPGNATAPAKTSIAAYDVADAMLKARQVDAA